MRYRTASLSSLVFAMLLLFRAAGARSDRIVFVPWKVIAPQAASPAPALVLYWIPVSAEEMRHSELITSRALAVYAARCVGMQVVQADDDRRIESLHAQGLLPVAVLMDGDREVSRVANESGFLRPRQVELMVRSAFDAREVAAMRRLEEAKGLALDGNATAAIDAYRSVSSQRCAFPRLAKEADRALRRLGVR